MKPEFVGGPFRLSWLLFPLAVLLGIVAAMAIFAGLVTKALAHEAPPSKTQPLGWTYGFECCSAIDCRQIGSAAVETGSKGYVIKQTGEVIPYGDKRLKRSKDEYYHQCTPGGDPNAKRSICLYTPDQGL